MARRRTNTTKAEIIRTAVHLFLEKGYSATSPKAICDELNLSTGNLTYYFQTKEQLLSVLVQMLCGFQWKCLQEVVEEGHTSVLAVCLELTFIAAMCEESEIARDFYLAAYSHPHTLEIIRKNDTQRAKAVFGQYCPDWTDAQYAAAEILVSGIEYATLMPTELPVTLEARITAAIDSILTAYNVPEPLRREKIQKALSLDYRGIGRQMLHNFKTYAWENTALA